MSAYTWVGYIVVVLLSIGFLLCAWAGAASATTSLIDRIRVRAAIEARKELGRRISLESYWFSESKDALTVLSCLGWHLTNQEGFDSNQLRERWRRERGTDDRP